MTRFTQFGGAPVTTSFADSFNRAGPGVGQNWFEAVNPWTPFINAVYTTTCSIGAMSDFTQGLLFFTAGTGGVGQYWQLNMVAIPNYMGIFGKTQFVQATIVDNVNVNRGGICVCNDSEGRGYYIQFVADTGVVNLQRQAGPGPGGNTLLQAGIATTAAGTGINETWRLSAQFNVGDVTLRLKKNGVAAGTFVDASAGRLSSGASGFLVGSIDSAALTKFNWKNFSSGLGL